MQIQESVVLPNMDDIAFFDSGPYEHRGGIWSETCRKPRAPSPSVVANQGESQSALTSILDGTTPAQDSSASTPTADNMSVQSAPAATTAPVEVSLSSSHSDDSPDAPRNITRRRTWFSSVRNEDSASSSSPDVFADMSLGDKLDQQDAHPQDSNTPQEQLPVRASHIDSHSPIHDSMVTADVEPSVLTHARSVSSRRSVSQHSIKVQADSTDQESQNKSNPTTPRKNSDASQARSPSPPSFFHTLKAKTADKQAIKETAKEAMRKWGVNWGGFKKDATSAAQPDEHSIGSSPPRSDDSQPDISKTLTHKPRASYAEVRAAVAERKARERVSQLLDHGTEHLIQLSPSSPESIGTGVQNSAPLSPGALPTNPETSINFAPATRMLGPKKKSTSSISRTEAEGHQDLHSPASEEPIKPVPIHVQPVAKTMSIPGIHASHRGEVQSMGYIAPHQPPSVPSGPMTETMLKNSAIQSVYRFLKSTNPGDRNRQDSLESAAQIPQQEHRVSTSSQSAVKETAEDLIDTGMFSPPPPGLKPQPKSVPPPLPPRRSGIILPSTQSESLASTSQFSASEALKNIVEKDDRSRTQSKSDSLTAIDVESSSSPSIVQERQIGDEGDDQGANSGPMTVLPEGHVDLQSVHDTMSKPSSLMDPSTPPSLPPRRKSILDASPGR